MQVRSTISEQGGFYRVSKLACEQYIQEFYKRFKLDYTILRYGSLYGAGASKDNTIQKIISNFKKKTFYFTMETRKISGVT